MFCCSTRVQDDRVGFEMALEEPKPLSPSTLREWNPKTDKHLHANYDITDFEQGKRLNKMKLQEEMGLPVNADIPMVAFIGRLDPQKGADILMQV